MDSPEDISPGRFGGQWAFLSNTPDVQPTRSLPAIVPPTDLDASQLVTNLANPPRSNLQRPSSTCGGTKPSISLSQPVLLRIHSADASAHLDPEPRIHKRKEKMIEKEKEEGQLPKISDFSIKSILAAVEEDIEDDINVIAEILGRSRFVLANQHDSHLPPQGEIRATDLQMVDDEYEADDVLITRDDASLITGSNAGSNAYRLLERLRVMPRTKRMRSDLGQRNRSTTPLRSDSSPAVLLHGLLEEGLRSDSIPGSSNLVSTIPVTAADRSTNVNGKVSHRQDEIGGRSLSDGRLGQLLRLNEFQSLTNWIMRSSHGDLEIQPDAENRLRAILNRDRPSGFDDG